MDKNKLSKEEKITFIQKCLVKVSIFGVSLFFTVQLIESQAHFLAILALVDKNGAGKSNKLALFTLKKFQAFYGDFIVPVFKQEETFLFKGKPPPVKSIVFKELNRLNNQTTFGEQKPELLRKSNYERPFSQPERMENFGDVRQEDGISSNNFKKIPFASLNVESYPYQTKKFSFSEYYTIPTACFTMFSQSVTYEMLRSYGVFKLIININAGLANGLTEEIFPWSRIGEEIQFQAGVIALQSFSDVRTTLKLYLSKEDQSAKVMVNKKNRIDPTIDAVYLFCNKIDQQSPTWKGVICLIFIFGKTCNFCIKNGFSIVIRIQIGIVGIFLCALLFSENKKIRDFKGNWDTFIWGYSLILVQLPAFCVFAFSLLTRNPKSIRYCICLILAIGVLPLVPAKLKPFTFPRNSLFTSFCLLSVYLVVKKPRYFGITSVTGVTLLAQLCLFQVNIRTKWSMHQHKKNYSRLTGVPISNIILTPPPTTLGAERMRQIIIQHFTKWIIDLHNDKWLQMKIEPYTLKNDAYSQQNLRYGTTNYSVGVKLIASEKFRRCAAVILVYLHVCFHVYLIYRIYCNYTISKEQKFLTNL